MIRNYLFWIVFSFQQRKFVVWQEKAVRAYVLAGHDAKISMDDEDEWSLRDTALLFLTPGCVLQERAEVQDRSDIVSSENFADRCMTVAWQERVSCANIKCFQELTGLGICSSENEMLTQSNSVRGTVFWCVFFPENWLTYSKKQLITFFLHITRFTLTDLQNFIKIFTTINFI